MYTRCDAAVPRRAPRRCREQVLSSGHGYLKVQTLDKQNRPKARWFPRILAIVGRE